MSEDTVGRKIRALMAAHPDSAKLSRKSQANILGADPATYSRWQNETTPEMHFQERAAQFFGISVSDFKRPLNELVKIVLEITNREWRTIDLQISSKFKERWRADWDELFSVIKGSHIIYLRIPLSSGGYVISASHLIISEVHRENGIKFSIFNVDNKSNPNETIQYFYSGMCFPISDSIFFIGEREDGAEPLTMVLDRPRQPIPLNGYLAAIGVATGKHYPMARRVYVIRISENIYNTESIYDRFGIFEPHELTDEVRRYTAEETSPFSETSRV